MAPDPTGSELDALRAQLGALEQRLQDLEGRLGGPAPLADGTGRFVANLNTVYHAATTGYVSLFFTGGRTGTVRLLVGRDQPPADCICEADTRHDLNSYAGGIVRVGEYWLAESTHSDRSAFQCVFTPLY